MTIAQTIPWARIRAWLFDLDGTLMDTDNQAVESLACKLRWLGDARAQRVARRAVMFSETPMNSVITLLDVVGLDPLLFAAQSMLHGPGEPTLRIMPGVAPLLHYLAEHAPLAVVSTRARSAAEAFLRQHELTALFRLCATVETTRRLKPHPEPVRYAAGQLGLAPEECVMVGDTTMDVLAARRAGAWAVAVLCGFGEERELRRVGAHLVLPSTADLLEIVSRET